MLNSRFFSSLLFILLGSSLICGIYLVIAGSSKKKVDTSLHSAQNQMSYFLKNIQSGPGVGIIEVYGEIYVESDGPRFPQLVNSGSDSIISQIDSLSNDKSVKALVLRINSPGGTIGAVQEIDSALKRAKAKGLYLVASMADVAASGGYYIAASCDEIVANPGTLTGSIGVIFSVMNAQGLMEKIGISQEVIKSGLHKDIGSFSRQMTDEEKKMLNNTIADVYSQFLAHVVKGRNMEEELIKPYADGRLMSGAEAKRMGLVDHLGDMDLALKIAAEKADLSDDNIRKIYPSSFGNDFFQRLFTGLNRTPLISINRHRAPKLMYMADHGMNF